MSSRFIEEILALCMDLSITLMIDGDQVRIIYNQGSRSPHLRHDMVIHEARHLMQLIRDIGMKPSLVPTPSEAHSITSADDLIEFRWNGISLQGPILAFDTKIGMTTSAEDYTIPQPMLAAAYDGQRCVIVTPDQMADFFRAHANHEWVFHAIATNFWVLQDHFRVMGADEAAQLAYFGESFHLFRF